MVRADEAKELFAAQQRASREALSEAELIVLTLGLTEVSSDRRDGATFYRVPNSRAFDSSINHFRIQSVLECVNDLERIHHLLAHANPKAQLVVCVSPEPLFATFRTDTDPISANQLSKATLRVAAEAFTSKHANAHYFPSYEIVTQVVDAPFKEDGRHVRPEVVSKVMETLRTRYSS